MKKLLVTGGAGFIGSEFTRRGIKKGYSIAVVDNLTYAGDLERIKEVESKISFYKADITNREFVAFVFKREAPDAVVHFAAESHVDRSILDASPFLETNIRGTQALLEISKEYGVETFVNISTDEVYGELKGEGQFHESSPLNPNSPYSVSKASADMLGRAYYRTYGLPVITVRPCNNYGPWQYPEKLLPVVIIKGLSDQRIPVYGTGQNVREWLSVADCAEAILLILEKGKIGQIYNVGSGVEKQNIEVVRLVLKFLGKPEGLIEFIADRLGHDFRYSMDSNKIKEELGWAAEGSFEKDLEATVQWYIDNLGWVNTKLHMLKNYWEKIYRP